MDRLAEHDDIKEMKEKLLELLNEHRELTAKVDHIARVIDEMHRRMGS